MNLKIYKFHFLEKESDVTIISESKNAILKAKSIFYFHRKKLETFITTNNDFISSFSPIKVNSNIEIVDLMVKYSLICDVGPMATVAGAFADLMLNEMKSKNQEGDLPAKIAMVENGGEIAINSEKSIKVALYAGFNNLNLNIGFLIEKKDCPIGIATSSATIGHAVSLGQADAVTIFAKNATLADGAATKICNLVKGNDVETSIKRGLDAIDDIDGIRGGLISRENKIGQAGRLPRMFKIEGQKSELLTKKVDDAFLGKFETIK
ncbi:MAG: UPF0280 family protein [Candidatus Thorarchaeota archaeon]